MSPPFSYTRRSYFGRRCSPKFAVVSAGKFVEEATGLSRNCFVFVKMATWSLAPLPAPSKTDFGYLLS